MYGQFVLNKLEHEVMIALMIIISDDDVNIESWYCAMSEITVSQLPELAEAKS